MTWTRSPFINISPAPPSPSQSTEGLTSRQKTTDDPDVGAGDDIFAEKARKAWGHGTQPEPRCDFSPGHTTLTPISGGARVATLWRRSPHGMTLSDIKSSGNLLSYIIPRVTEFIRSILGPSPSPESYIIVSPPKRRHPGRQNFASRLCEEVARLLNLTYIDDFAICRTRARINPEFTIAAPIPEQPSVIVIDDILTTGSTLTAMHTLLTAAGKSPILIAAILNRK